MGSLVVLQFVMDPDPHHYKFLSWNVRGLNSSARQEDVKQVVQLYKPDLVCLQEIKMESVSQHTIRNALGHAYQDNFAFLWGKGGIIIAANNVTMNISNPSTSNHTLSVSAKDLRTRKSWLFTGVYGHQGTLEKKLFIRELRHLKQGALQSWLIMGDFNLVYQDEDKNSGNLDRTLMHGFRRALNFLEVKEIQLNGRNFTWSNRQANPPMSRID
jgi:exonuclease III